MDIKKKLFIHTEDKDEIAKIKKQIEATKKKLKERADFILESKAKINEMKKLKKVYQDVAILRHKMLKHFHRKKSRRRKEAA